MNAFGIDVSRLDVASFLHHLRLAMIVLVLFGLWLLARRGRPVGLVVGVVLANSYVWLATNYPLQRLYALGPSADRVNNVGLAQVVGVGGRPLETTQIYQSHFEPFWGWLVSTLALGDPERLLRIYPFLSLIIVAAFAVSIYAALRPPAPASEWPEPWERALMAGFATLLCAAPMDFQEDLRNPWSMTFVLKPNHALGLVLVPWFLRSFARIRGFGTRLFAGFVLQAIAWAFVLHMVYVATGLLIFAGLSLLRRTPDRRRDLIDVASVIGVNLLVVSPYLILLFRGYPFLVPSTTAIVPATHLLEPSAAIATVFLLAAWGARVALLRSDRLSRLVGSLWLGAWLVWLGYFILDRLNLARERDDLYFYVRILTALIAAIGAWDLARRVVAALAPAAPSRLRAAALCLAAFPYSVAYWWDPIRMDDYFKGSTTPLPAMLTDSADYLRRHAPPEAVLAGDPAFARDAAALAGRRGLLVTGMNPPRDVDRRRQLTRKLAEGETGAEVRREAEFYGVRYLAVTPELLRTFPNASVIRLDQSPQLALVHRSIGEGDSFVALYELLGAP